MTDSTHGCLVSLISGEKVVLDHAMFVKHLDDKNVVLVSAQLDNGKFELLTTEKMPDATKFTTIGIYRKDTGSHFLRSKKEKRSYALSRFFAQRLGNWRMRAQTYSQRCPSTCLIRQLGVAKCRFA